MWTDFQSIVLGVPFDLLVRATILLVIAGIIVVFLRRASAAYRHLVWVIALASILVQPLLYRIPNPWSVTILLPVARRIIPVQPQESHITPAVAAGIAPTKTTVTTHSPLPWMNILLCVWLGGATLVISQLLLGIRRIRRIAQRSVAPTEGLAVTVRNVLSGLSLPRPVSVLIAPKASHIHAPMTWGWYRPSLLLPASAADWEADQVRAALLHEAGHIRRVDWVVQIGIVITCAVYWWHPLVWWAARQAQEESERACDDIVLSAGIPSADYAALLLAVARAVRGNTSHQGTAMSMAQSSGVEKRIRATLSKNLNRRPVTKRNLAIGVGLATLLLSAFVCLHPAFSASRNPISFYYLSNVECQADRSRSLQLNQMGKSSTNNTIYLFTDKRTGATFHDGATIMAAFTQLAQDGNTPRSGASAFTVPDEFRQATTRTTLYLTTKQRTDAESLRREIKAWQSLLAHSPRILSAADLTPKTVTTETKVFGIRLTLFPSGAKKLEDFTAKHRGEILGIVIDPDQPGSKLQMAPSINETLTSKTIEISPFANRSDAEAFAEHLNIR